MRPNPAIMQALSKERFAELVRVAGRDRHAARVCRRVQARAAVAHGSSLRLRDGRWVHLRHDSA
jgi:hypothetical protein